MITLPIENEPILHIKLVDNEGGTLPMYTGSYTVVPRKVDQQLLTKNTSMANNVTVEKITRTETSNDAGGKTVIIGFD